MKRNLFNAIGVFALGGLLQGCKSEYMPILNPNGFVGESEKALLYISTTIMAFIVVPVIIGTLWIVWKYRESTQHNDYDPEFVESPILTKITVYVPLLTIGVLGLLTWVYTHRVDPYRPFGGDTKPYEIQAIGLDYKWLFIYPDKKVATVNTLVAPVDRPVTLRLTSDPMMTSIFVPGLLSQIYSMPGMETRVNFQAVREQEIPSSNANWSGPGFHFQRFKTHLVTGDKFDAWLADVASGSTGGQSDIKVESTLDSARYDKLREQTKSYYPITYFSSVDDGMFQQIVRRFRPNYTMGPLPTENEYMGREPAQMKTGQGASTDKMSMKGGDGGDTGKKAGLDTAKLNAPSMGNGNASQMAVSDETSLTTIKFAQGRIQ